MAFLQTQVGKALNFSQSCTTTRCGTRLTLRWWYLLIIVTAGYCYSVTLHAAEIKVTRPLYVYVLHDANSLNEIDEFDASIRNAVYGAVRIWENVGIEFLTIFQNATKEKTLELLNNSPYIPGGLSGGCNSEEGLGDEERNLRSHKPDLNVAAVFFSKYGGGLARSNPMYKQVYIYERHATSSLTIAHEIGHVLIGCGHTGSDRARYKYGRAPTSPLMKDGAPSREISDEDLAIALTTAIALSDPPEPQFATRIHCEEYELIGLDLTGNVEYSTSHPNTVGNHSCKISYFPNTNGGKYSLPMLIKTEVELWVRFEAYLPTAPTQDLRLIGLVFRDSSASISWDYTTSEIHRFYGYGGLSPLHSTRVVNGYPVGKNEWVAFELYVKFRKSADDDSTAVHIRAYVNNKLIHGDDDLFTTFVTKEYVESILFLGQVHPYEHMSPLYIDNVYIQTKIPDETDSNGKPYIGTTKLWTPKPPKIF